jgi:hypothetical protein
MADVTPKLSSATDASEVRYAPLSWLAVGSLVMGGLFVLTFAILGFISYQQSKPLLNAPLLAIPIIGLLLAFAARRSIRQSEGARTGLQYANIGWWLCVIGGLCYGAYLFGTDWTIRTDAERQMKTWAEKFATIDPNKTDDPVLRDVFIQTVEIERKNSRQVTDPSIFQATFGAPLNTFRHSNLVMLTTRNRDSVQIVPQGLRYWEQQEQDIKCTVAGVLSCAEGDFPLEVQLRSAVSEQSRQWQVTGQPVYIPQDQSGRPFGARTRYGWLIDRLQGDAKELTQEFALTLMNQQPRQTQFNSAYPFPPLSLGQALATETYIDKKLPRDIAEKILVSSLGRFQLAGPTALIWPSRADLPEDFFGREDGKPLSADDRKVLSTIWNPTYFNPMRLVPAGWINTGDPIRSVVIGIEANKLTVKVPIEMKPAGGDFLSNPALYTLGKLVFVCDDPATLTEFNQARTAPRQLISEPPGDLREKRFPLRVVRVESNMMKASPPAPKPGG